MNKIKCFAFLAFLAASSGLLAGTATKEYVDRRDSTIAVAATNYTDAAVAAVGGVTRETVTNIAEYVTGNATNGLPEAIAAKYTKPAGGIPASDIAEGVIPVLPTAWSWVMGLTGFPTWITANKPTYTAAEVGARADDWMPSAADVGALAVTGGTITNSATATLQIGANAVDDEDIGKSGTLYIGGNGSGGSSGGVGKLYLGGNGYETEESLLQVGGRTEHQGDGKILVGGNEGKGTIIVNGNSWNVASVTIGDGSDDTSGELIVGGTDVMSAISAKMDTTERPLILSEAMSATASYLTQTNITELTPYSADSIVGKIHSAPSPAGAAVAKSTIEYNASGTACIVTIAAGGQLAATTTGWPNGQATTAIITIGAGATIADNISLVGYGSWPVGEAFIASCVYYNSKVRVVPIQKVQ